MNENHLRSPIEVRCPRCSWRPPEDAEWACISCHYEWNMFTTAGGCPRCSHQHDQTYCIEWLGGCGETSAHLDWYPQIDDTLGELNIKKLFD